MAITRGQPKDEVDEQGGTNDPNGRIDFYASFGQRSVALELKRVAISTVRRNGCKGLADRWATVGKQARQALTHMRKHKDDFPYAAGIGLLVIRVSRGVTSRRDDREVQLSAASRFTELVDEVRKTTKPDFLAAYRPPAEMQVIEGWGKDGNGVKVFPGVIFAASVHVRDA